MSGNSLAMMPWFPRDFIAATRHLALAERGAYRELLDHQWELGALPTDETRLARILGVTIEEFAPIWSAIKDKFQVLDGYLLNNRLEQHRKEAIARRDKKVKGAALTNAKRYGERVAKRVDIASPPSPSPSPSPSTEEVRLRDTVPNGTVVESSTSTATKTVKATDLDQVKQVFEHWQQEWGHPGSKLDTKRASRIRARFKEGFTAEHLCNAISGFKHSPWHTGTDPRSEGVVYDGIETLLRDSSQVETGIRLLERPPKPPEQPRKLSIVEEAIAANQADAARRRGEHDERVVSEQRQQGREDLDRLDTDVRSAFGTRLRTLGA